MYRLFLIGLTILLFASSCCDKYNDTDTPNPKEFIFNFQTDNEGWMGNFADYPNEPNVENFYELDFSYSMLPSPLNNNKGALRQSGNNHINFIVCIGF